MRCIVLAAALTLSASAALAFTTQQAAQGRQLFARHCALTVARALRWGRPERLRPGLSAHGAESAAGL
jgi:hypothetical protein